MRRWRTLFGRRRPDGEDLRERLARFRSLVESNNRVLELIADAGEKLGGEYIFDRRYITSLADELEQAVRSVVYDLGAITGEPFAGLQRTVTEAGDAIRGVLEGRVATREAELVIPFDDVDAELFDVVGEKMARLGELRRHLGCRTPDGFVVTAWACRNLLTVAGVDRARSELTAAEGPVDPDQASTRLTRLVIEARLPRRLERRLRRAARRLGGRCPHGLAVRSSALGEDGELSFAGQLRSILGVAPARVPEAYREVVASLFAPGVMRYRERHGIELTEGLMAVGCLCTIPARAAGVIYTLDPTNPGHETLLVAAAPGLGTAVVDGAEPVDRFELERAPPHRVRSRSIASKLRRGIVARAGGTTTAPIPDEERQQPAVDDEALRELATTALDIERYMKCAQDIEWAVDDDGRLVILQARPLVISREAVPVDPDLSDALASYEVLLGNQGAVACRGIGAGPVHLVGDESVPDEIPHGAVLVARTSSPRLAAAVGAASAVVTDVGTPTGHLAAIARELRVPTIVDAGNATELLARAGEVTVDAEENIVYAGRVAPLLHRQLLQSSSFEDAPEYRLLRAVLRRVAPLSLTDPQSPDFTASSCVTYHDVIRFAHERAVEALTSGQQWVRATDARPFVRRVALTVPLDLILIDLGGGLVASEDGRGPVGPDEVASAPLRALLAGLEAPGVWATEPAAVDLDSFMSSATRAGPLAYPLAAPEQNLAIVSPSYLHLSLRLGYHFNVVDCYLTEQRNDNYVYFRFAGGVTELARRSRRAELLKRVLGSHDFVVEGKGDLVIGRIKKITADEMKARLQMIGRLIGFTRQLDVSLRDDTIADELARRFLESDGALPGR